VSLSVLGGERSIAPMPRYRADALKFFLVPGGRALLERLRDEILRRNVAKRRAVIVLIVFY
jgi:hypothetical protein